LFLYFILFYIIPEYTVSLFGLPSPEEKKEKEKCYI